MKTLTTSTLFLLLLGMPLFAVAQSASDLGLVLRGTTASNLSCKRTSPELSCYAFRMVFENRGKEPIIILNPTLGYGTGIKSIVFLFREYNRLSRAVDDVEGSQRQIVPDPTKLESFRSMANLVDTDRPSENMTIILEPNQTFTFVETFEVEREKPIPDSVAQELMATHPGWYSAAGGGGWYHIPDSIRLVYEFSFLPYVSDPDLLEHLNQRWGKYGRLPVGQNGIYSITSEPIK